MNLSLGLALASIALWIVLVFVLHLASGWPHLFLAAGIILCIRRVVTGPKAW